MIETLGEYVEEIRLRHPRLSMRQMSLDIGKSPSLIGQIINQNKSVSPATLKLIEDKFGREGDFEEMMRLAGHPLPEAAQDAPLMLTPTEELIVRRIEVFTPEERQRLLELSANTPESGAIGREAFADIEPTAADFEQLRREDNERTPYDPRLLGELEKIIIRRYRTSTEYERARIVAVYNEMPRTSSTSWEMVRITKVSRLISERMAEFDEETQEAVTEMLDSGTSTPRIIAFLARVLGIGGNGERSERDEEIEAFIRRFERLPRRYQEHLFFQARSLWLAYMAERSGITPDEQEQNHQNGLSPDTSNV